MSQCKSKQKLSWLTCLQPSLLVVQRQSLHRSIIEFAKPFNCVVYISYILIYQVIRLTIATLTLGYHAYWVAWLGWGRVDNVSEFDCDVPVRQAKGERVLDDCSLAIDGTGVSIHAVFVKPDIASTWNHSYLWGKSHSESAFVCITGDVINRLKGYEQTWFSVYSVLASVVCHEFGNDLWG